MAPTITITSPLGGTIEQGGYITADIADPSYSVVLAQLKLDGVVSPPGYPDLTAPPWRWGPMFGSDPEGTVHKFYVIATNSNGGSRSSAVQTVTVTAPRLLKVTHTGNASRVQIDTTGLWQSQGGDVPDGTLLTVDGKTAPKWTQPTAAAPVVTWNVTPGPRTFALGAHAVALDVVYRTFPWTSQSPNKTWDQANIYYYGDTFPLDPKGPFKTTAAQYNGYSIVPVPGSSAAVFCVAPGDDGSAGNATMPEIKQDCRAHLNFQDNLEPDDEAEGHPDVLGNVSRTVRFISFDVEIPTSWEAPVEVSNRREPWMTDQLADRPNLKFWPNTPNDIEPRVNPATGDYTASRVVVNNFPDVAQSLPSVVEDQGPGTFLWWEGNGAGQVQFRWQALSMGVGLGGITFGARTPEYDRRYRFMLEEVGDLCATSDGELWIVPPGAITAPRTTPWSTTHPVAPYGVPPGVPGGGYIRMWESYDDGATWTCITAGHPYAVPGTPTINADGTISGGDAGKMFGPTQKSNGAQLATAIPAALEPPFNITLSDLASPMSFGPVGVMRADCHVNIGGEWMRFHSWDGTTKVMQITQRAPVGSRVDHAVGEQVIGQQDVRVLSVGPLTIGKPEPTDRQLPIPVAFKLWPMNAGQSFGAVAAAAVNDT